MENIQKYNQENSLKKLSEIGNNTIKIVVLFAIMRGYKFDNREQLKSFIKRNRKHAIELKDYPIEKIANTIKYLNENADFKFTISTIGKYIDEDLAKLSIKNAKTIKV